MNAFSLYFGWYLISEYGLHCKHCTEHYTKESEFCIYDPYYQHTYLLTPWCRVILEKLTGLQLVKKFPAFHGTRRFITALTSVRHLSLPWASPIQSIYLHPTSWSSIVISTHLRLGLPSGLLPSDFPSKILYTPSPHPYAPHAQPISFFPIFSPAQYRVRSTDHYTSQTVKISRHFFIIHCIINDNIHAQIPKHV